MKILRYDDQEKDIIQITREEFREKYIDFIDDNSLTKFLDKEGRPLANALERMKNIILFNEFEDLLFGKEINEKSGTCDRE